MNGTDMADSVSKSLKDLDDKINACIKDISDIFGGIENLDKNFAVLNTGETSSEFCNVLQILVSLLSDHLGIAEYLLPHLDEIRKQNNMKFCDLNLHVQNIIENDVPDLKHKEQILWNNVCFYIKKYSVAALSKNYIPLSSIHNHFNLCQLRNYCVSLQNIFVSKDIWEKYKNFRIKYMKMYICECKPDGCCLNCYLKLSIQCIYEDHLLCYLGCFHPHIVTQTSILEIYSEIIHKAFSKLLQMVNHSIKSNKCLPNEIINMLLYSKNTYQENYRTCFTCFIQYNLLDEIESVIYCIQKNVDTDTLWNKLFIFSILKITEIITLFEDQINILFNLGKDINFHSHDEDLSSLFEGSKLILATDSPEESPFHESHHQGSTKQCLSSNQTPFSWNWRLILVENGYITEIQRALQTEVEKVIKTTMEREKLLLKTNDWRSLLKCDKKLNFASLTVQTYTLLDSVLDTVLVLEKYVSVLSSAIGVLQPFKYSFSHTLDAYVVDLLKHLQYISEFESNINYLYIATNNALFLKNQLKYYCDIMEGPDGHVNENCMNNVCRSVNKLHDRLFESLLNLHFKYVSCGILFDSDCYNFQDTKPFFEGERISYSIQMWKMYMEGLYHDVTYFLPQSLAQELYGKVLVFSLDRFLIRYSKSAASEARYPQILQDIYAILLCTSELIYPACSYMSEVVGKKEEFNETKIASIVNKIHSNCCCLLSVLVVLTSPITELYTVFKDGFPQPRLSIRSKYECLSPWLPWIRRELFSNFGQSKIMSNVSVWLAVQVCTTYKVPLPNAIIQAFTEHHCTLSILLMMQVASMDDDVTENISVEENKIKLAYSLSVLILCYDNCSYLLDIFLPVIERTNGWDEFDESATSILLSERSWWYVGLYRALKPFLQSVLEEMVSFWLQLKGKSSDIVSLKQWINFRDEIKKYVACVCQNNSMNSFNENFSFTSEVISFLCLEKILEKLYDNLMFLPEPFKYTLICLDAHVANYMPEIHPAENSVCIQFLLSSIIAYLNEEEFIDKLPTGIKEIPGITSDALNALCTEEDMFCNNAHYKKKLTKLLTLIKGEFDSQKNGFDTKSKSANFDEIQEDVLILTAKKIVEMPKGISIILYLHQILCANKVWIQSNLGIPDMLSPDIVLNPISPSPLLRSSLDSPSAKKELKPNLQTSNLAALRYSNSGMINEGGESFESEGSMENTFVISQEMLSVPDESGTRMFEFSLLVDENISSSVYNFNPLHCFDTLGASTFTKVAAERPQLPWEALLSHLPILGITEVNFQILFSQRWDVISDINSSAEEMRQIEELKNLYKYDEK